MKPVSVIEDRARRLPLDNLDTDQLCPARFMKRRRTEGYGDALLHDLRFAPDGTVRPNPIDDAPGAILLAGRNFGGGSSREAAVYALLDAGIGAVVASSFGDIFTGNAVRNGLVPALVDEAVLAALHAAPDTALRLDLTDCTIRQGNQVHAFRISETARTMLIKGWDDADVTAQHADAVVGFLERDRAARPWAHAIAQKR